MPKFVVADQSVRSQGGHHFEYAVHVLEAAEQLGLEPVLVAHKSMRHTDLLPRSWHVSRPFKCRTHPFLLRKIDHLRHRSRRASLATKCLSPRRWVEAVDLWRYDRRRRRFLADYGAALSDMFRRFQLSTGDHVFLSTTIPLDVAGLLDWVRNHPEAAHVHWHVQFHYPLIEAPQWHALEGEGWEEKLSSTAEAVHALQAALPPGRLHWYCTTEALARQYEYCLGITIETLPYPVNETLGSCRQGDIARQKLRVACLGQIRDEKGQQHWPEFIEELWHDGFEPGRLQLVVQSPSLKGLPEPLRKIADYDGARRQGPRDPHVAVAPWPLSTAEYLRLIAGADVGLFTYDPLQYYFRCSGILVEMLSAGIPVLVRGGCWLADQFSEQVYAHQEQWRQRLPIVERFAGSQISWRRPHGPLGAASGAQGQLPLEVGRDELTVSGELMVPDSATHLLVCFERDRATVWNTYVELGVRQMAADGTRIKQTTDVLGPRAAGPITALVPLEPQARSLRLTWQNAFNHVSLAIKQIDCCFLSATGQPALPRSAVGLIAGDSAIVPELLAELVAQYDAYCRSARDFAERWSPVHTPNHVVRQMVARTRTGKHAA